MLPKPLKRPVVGLAWRVVPVLALVALVASAGPAAAQKLEIQNKSNVLLGRTQVVDTATLTFERFSVGFSNTFLEGRSLANVLSARLEPKKSTTLFFDTQVNGAETLWEVKVNQKYRAFTFDLGGGSNGLFHTGLQYGQRKGKGFGLSAAWVADDRNSGPNLQLWHYVEAIDVVVAIRHDRRGFGWSANTGDKLANILRGVLRYETSSGADGNGSSQQMIYGRSMRDGSDTYTGFEQLRFVPEEDVFGGDGINIRSPMYRDDDPLAWLLEGYGARFGEVELDEEKTLAAEMVSYISDTVWVGGDLMMKDGLTEVIDAQFGITAQDLKLAATFGYAPQSGRFGGTVQLRWVPFKPAAAK